MVFREMFTAPAGSIAKQRRGLQRRGSILDAVLDEARTLGDQLGQEDFSFDNFDAIGRWRTTEQVAGGNDDDPPVNARGQLADGRLYRNAEEFKHLLANDLDRFAEAFVEQLATYALRRVMTIDDAAEIKAIAAVSKQNGYRLRAVIANLVVSDLMRKR